MTSWGIVIIFFSYLKKTDNDDEPLLLLPTPYGKTQEDNDKPLVHFHLL
jgi:hypothetical protein